ncbi:MAG: hypothetical protein QNI84_07245 [Henriciella sp.]|nr:hypothetical protein [Henriciella sp.]
MDRTREFAALSMMIEHISEHLIDLGVKDPEINKTLARLQFLIFRHYTSSHLKIVPNVDDDKINEATGTKTQSK